MIRLGPQGADRVRSSRMSHDDRGPYAPPSEPPLTMDHRRPPRGGGPAPVTLIVSVLLLAAAAGGVFYLYRGGARDSSGVPRPVGAPIGEVKVAAPPQAQPEDPAAGLSIYRDSPGAAPPAPAFVPPPEQPMPRPVAAPPPSASIRAAPLEATPPAEPARKVAAAAPTPAPAPAKAKLVPKPIAVAVAEPPPDVAADEKAPIWTI